MITVGQKVKLGSGRLTCSLGAAVGSPHAGKQKEQERVSLDYRDGGCSLNLRKF